MTQELVLITGGTGFVGYACVVRALDQGYRVRLAVRSESSIEIIKNAPSCQPRLNSIEFVVVNDITQEGAFNEAMQGVSYVIHVASPTPRPDMAGPSRDIVVKPAVAGTINILQAAIGGVPSVKRVVITSSESVFMTDDQTRVHDENTMAPVPDDSFAEKDIKSDGSTAKVLAHRATQDFLRTRKPHFTITEIMPSFVVGKHELLTTPEDIISPRTTNSVALAPIFGEGLPFPFPGGTVHVDDVAMVHIAALGRQIDGNEDFILTAGGIDGIQWNDAKGIVRKRFPAAVEKGLLPCRGSSETRAMKVDGGKAERVFGFKYKDFEEQIVSVMGQYLKAVERSNPRDWA